MYIAIYRWKLKPGREAEFTQNWDEGTVKFRDEHHSLGSRLHLGDDGTYFAYAQWPSKEAYHRKKELSETHRDNLAKMSECVAEQFPTILGEVSCDWLMPPKEKAT